MNYFWPLLLLAASGALLIFAVHRRAQQDDRALAKAEQELRAMQDALAAIRFVQKIKRRAIDQAGKGTRQGT